MDIVMEKSIIRFTFYSMNGHMLRVSKSVDVDTVILTLGLKLFVNSFVFYKLNKRSFAYEHTIINHHFPFKYFTVV